MKHFDFWKDVQRRHTPTLRAALSCKEMVTLAWIEENPHKDPRRPDRQYTLTRVKEEEFSRQTLSFLGGLCHWA